jgi:hypothetical protein
MHNDVTGPSSPIPKVVSAEVPPEPPKKRLNKKHVIAGLLVIVALAVALVLLLPDKKVPNQQTAKSTPKTAKTTNTTNLPGVQLNPAKNYGNKYASGVLPVGDSKYVSDAGKQGSVYVCSGYARNLSSGRGPWFSADGTTYDLNKKAHVQGAVAWQASFSNQTQGIYRAINTNDLPNHVTGIFPISAHDPAYAYDRNPNTIKAQSLSYNLSVSPTYGPAQCMGGQVGIMLTGVALFNGFDAGGRDAGAWEVQDSCDGHPEVSGTYHYHTLSSCIKDTNVKTVIGFALDGFPITGPKVADNNILTTSDLDECHGLTSQIVLDGKDVTMYHYVMTQDFPYSVSCFRATPIDPPGQKQAGQPPA